MNFFEWYLNLSFWQAVLVWLKLLLPVLFGLIVFALIVIAARLFSGSLSPSGRRSPSGRQSGLSQNIQPKRIAKTEPPMPQ